jgi:hypothetical protein
MFMFSQQAKRNWYLQETASQLHAQVVDDLDHDFGVALAYMHMVSRELLGD